MKENTERVGARASTAYSESEASVYDAKRFSSPQGRLFDRLEKENLISSLESVPREGSILEVGCGTGRFLSSLRAWGCRNIFAVDYSYPMLLQTKKKAPESFLSQAEGARLPFKNDVFDFVYSIRVINQLSSKEYAQKMMSETIRVCKDQGFILLELVNSRSLSVRRRPCVRFSVKEATEQLMHARTAEIQKVSGILFFTGTLLHRMPAGLLGAYERIERAFSKALPGLCTRFYVFMKKCGPVAL